MSSLGGRGKFAIACCALGFVACMDNPVGPGALGVVLVGRSNDTLWTGSPGDPFPDAVNIRVVGEGGRPVAGAMLTWEAVGRSARVADVSERTDGNGRARARWLLGTDASQEQQLRVTVSASHEQAELIVRARLVPTVVSGLRVSGDSVVRLGDTLALHVDAVDPYGNVFPAPDVSAAVSDSAIGHGSGAVVIGGPKRGAATVRLESHGVGAAVPLHVTQYVAAIVPARDTLVFSALGAELPVSYVVRDDRGRVVADTAASVSVTDTNIARVSGAVVRSLTTGIAALSLQVASTSTVVPLVVDQRIATLRLHRDTIRFDALFDTTTLHPIAKDSLGADVQQPVLQVAVDNQQIAEVATGTLIQAITPGVTVVTLVDPETGISTSVPVVVHQLVRAIDINPVTFDALGDTSTAAVTPRDRLGYTVAGAGLDYSVSDTTIATVDGTGQLHSVRPGTVTLSVRDQETGALTATDVVVQQRIASLVLDRDTLTFDALLDTAAFSLVGRDRLGALVADAAARTTYVSTNSGVIEVSPGGATRSVGNGTALVIAQSTDGPADSVRVLVEQRVASIAVTQDTVAFDALKADRGLGAEALDRLGSVVGGASIAYSVDDAAIARVDTAGRVVAVANGTTQVRAQASGVMTTVAVRVVQKPVRVTTPVDTVHLTAFGDTATIGATALDSLGSPVSGSLSALSVADTNVVQALDSATVRARANGSSSIQFSIAGLTGSTVVRVRQVAESLTAVVLDDRPILALPAGGSIHLSCTVFDRNHFVIDNPQVVVSSAHQKIQGSSCADLVATNSGFDTATVRVDSAAVRVPLLIAVQPVSFAPQGNYLTLDSFPVGASPWAPSIWQAPNGQIVLFTTVYYPDSTRPGVGRGDLHRYISNDGVSFNYDGVVLQRDSTLCSLNGSGIENVAIVPRQDGAGWRMFYAGGSFSCYGWQVFSAVSDDGRSWTKEPGVRLSNGGPVPPAPTQVPPYPVGEGMAIDVLPSGASRMIVGSFEHVNPPPVNQWQITEWQSINQVDWSYVGTALTTRDMPIGAQGSVYSPSIVEVVPGLWRMFFTADDRPKTGSRSTIWSAVSTDRRQWVLENGPIASAANSDLFYATVLGNHLYFIRRDIGGGARLASTLLDMK